MVASLLSDRFALVLAWIGVIVLFSVLRPDTFASTANLKTILSSQSVLVIISLALGTHLTFALPALYIGALAVSAITVWQVTDDGEARAFEGWALIAIYAILAVITLLVSVRS